MSLFFVFFFCAFAVMIKMNDSRSTMITGGPLDENIYLFEQLHFHWGENDTRGSEDTINNHSYAMELHAVFYKKNYNSIEEATRHPDGLTVLAYFFEVGEEPNQMYQPLVDRLEDVHKAGQKAMLQSPLLLKSLLLPYSSVSQNYFTYNGSLTTPPCSEVVTWIDFKEPLLLSHEQVRTGNWYIIYSNLKFELNVNLPTQNNDLHTSYVYYIYSLRNSVRFSLRKAKS